MQDAVAFDPPGRGHWRREVAHFPRGQTPLYRAIYAPASAEGMRASLARYGVAGSHLQMAYVNDFSYVRLVPLVETPRALASRPPPNAATWLLTRLVPRFRQRTRAALASRSTTRAWREDGRRWYEVQKPAFEAANLALQDEPVDEMNAGELVDHLRRAFDNLRYGIEVHFDLAIVNLIAVGDFLVAAQAAGIEPADALALLRGSSPASAEVVAMLDPVVRAADAAGPMTTLDDLRQLGPQSAVALDGYLRRFGHRVVAAYDIDQPTLHELPDLVVKAVRTLARKTTDSSSMADAHGS